MNIHLVYFQRNRNMGKNGMVGKKGFRCVGVCVSVCVCGVCVWCVCVYVYVCMYVRVPECVREFECGVVCMRVCTAVDRG